MSDVTTTAVRERRWGARSIASLLIFVIAVLLTPIALVGHWGYRTVVDSERYIQTVGPLIDDPAVQQSITTAVTDTVVANLDTQSQVEQLLVNLLPGTTLAGPLSGPIAAGINGLIGNLVERFVQSDAFATAWIALNRAAQRSAMALLEGGQDGPVQIRGDEIVLDVSSALQVIQQHIVDAGITVAGNITIPDTGRYIPLVTAEGLGQIRFIYALTSPILAWLPAIVAAMFLLSIALARRRPRTSVAVGIALLVWGVILTFVLNAAHASFTNQLAGTPFGPASSAFWDTMLQYLILGIEAILVLSVAIIIAGWFAGRNRPAIIVRTPVVRGLRQIGDRLPDGVQPLRRTLTRWAPWILGAIVVLAVLILLISDLMAPSTVLWVSGLSAGLVTALGILTVSPAAGAPAIDAPVVVEPIPETADVLPPATAAATDPDA